MGMLKVAIAFVYKKNSQSRNGTEWHGMEQNGMEQSHRIF